jgi:hypothetical protein
MTDRFEEVAGVDDHKTQDPIDVSDDIEGRRVMQEEFGGDRAHGVDTRETRKTFEDILGAMQVD